MKISYLWQRPADGSGKSVLRSGRGKDIIGRRERKEKTETSVAVVDYGEKCD